MTKHGGLVQNPLCWLEHKCRNIVVDWKICSTQKCQLQNSTCNCPRGICVFVNLKKYRVI